MEEPITRLVNVEHVWIYYCVETKQQSYSYRVAPSGDEEASDEEKEEDEGEESEETLDYVSELICSWHQLDKDKQAIDGTKGSEVIRVAPPAQPKGALPSDSNSQSGASSRHRSVAYTVLEYDELVLEDTITLRDQRKVMVPLVESLRDLQEKRELDKETLQNIQAVIQQLKHLLRRVTSSRSSG